MSQLLPFNAIVFDIGDVLFTWSDTTTNSISSKTVHHILKSSVWSDYERGKLSEDSCSARVATEFSLPQEDVRQAFVEARDSLKSNDELLASIRTMKQQSNGTLRVFAMSNISLPDYQALRAKPADWGMFERIFTSAEFGERKPSLGFYQHVLDETKIDPRRAIFVDDKLENVASARVLGLHGIVFPKEGSKNVIQALLNLTGSRIE